MAHRFRHTLSSGACNVNRVCLQDMRHVRQESGAPAVYRVGRAPGARPLAVLIHGVGRAKAHSILFRKCWSLEHVL